MKFCIQDPSNSKIYFVDEADLASWVTDPDDYTAEIDVLLVVPGDDVIQQLPATRLADTDTPTVQIVDPNRNKSWILTAEALDKFSVESAPANGDDIAWFAMPSARELMAAVPMFRKALVQHGC